MGKQVTTCVQVFKSGTVQNSGMNNYYFNANMLSIIHSVTQSKKRCGLLNNRDTVVTHKPAPSHQIAHLFHVMLQVVTSVRHLHPQTDQAPSLVHQPPYHLSIKCTQRMSSNGIPYTHRVPCLSIYAVFYHRTSQTYSMSLCFIIYRSPL